MKFYFNSEWEANSIKLKPFGFLAANDVVVSVERFFTEKKKLLVTRTPNSFDFIFSSSVSEKSDGRGGIVSSSYGFAVYMQF